jgi:FMN-dependent NADH-azoreductase
MSDLLDRELESIVKANDGRYARRVINASFPEYDSIVPDFTGSVTKVFRYYLDNVLVATETITYTDSNKTKFQRYDLEV